MTDINKVIEELSAIVEWSTKYDSNNSIIGICTRAIEHIKYQEAAIKELKDYIIDIENYHEERLERLQSLTNISFSAEEGV